MSMPETAVNEYDGVTAGKCEVRLTGQVRAMKPKAVSQSMRETPHDHLWASIVTFNGPHDRAAVCAHPLRLIAVALEVWSVSPFRSIEVVLKVSPFLEVAIKRTSFTSSK